MRKPSFQYLFGPVVSRRLGRSLGVDIVPPKICCQNCLYCQLGKSVRLTLERKRYVPAEAVLEEIRQWLALGQGGDYITIGGSGEPTLNSDLGKIVEGIRALTHIPIAILTNGATLFMSEVRADCAKADVVLPSLDAGDEETYRRLNQPAEGLTFQHLIDGLCQFRKEYQGQIWLEVFFCLGINTDSDSIDKIRQLINEIRPDRVHLNTAVRPPADASIVPVPAAMLRQIAQQVGHNAEVIAEFEKLSAQQISSLPVDISALAERILAIVRRHPCCAEELATALNQPVAVIQSALDCLAEQQRIEKTVYGWREKN